MKKAPEPANLITGKHIQKEKRTPAANASKERCRQKVQRQACCLNIKLLPIWCVHFDPR
jgi:L-fucose isomerase-like protein